MDAYKEALKAGLQRVLFSENKTEKRENEIARCQYIK